MLAAPHVDWVVRGQGEQTFLEPLDVLDGTCEPHDVAGLCFRTRDGSHHIGVERRLNLSADPRDAVPLVREMLATSSQ